MGQKTNISWTDATFNPFWGCTKVSAGCDNCYAEAFDARWGEAHWGKGVPRREFGEAHWNEPLAWNRKAEAAGKPMKVFCGSMCDVMDDEAPAGARERLWELIDATPHLIWQLLTKRPQRYKRYLPASFKHTNVWPGTSTEDQANYDLRWPILHRLVADRGMDVAWISYEPALGPLTMMDIATEYGAPDWAIFGGESGNDRRPMDPSWAANLKAECKLLGTSFWLKQYGARTPKMGEALVPADMLLRQFPLMAGERVTA